MADARPPLDDEVISRIAAGDREAFALLYRRYRADVYRFAAHVSGSPAVADDVVQDVFVAVIEGASGYRADRSGSCRGCSGSRAITSGDGGVSARCSPCPAMRPRMAGT